jgi:hypothetical protein
MTKLVRKLDRLQLALAEISNLTTELKLDSSMQTQFIGWGYGDAENFPATSTSKKPLTQATNSKRGAKNWCSPWNANRKPSQRNGTPTSAGSLENHQQPTITGGLKNSLPSQVRLLRRTKSSGKVWSQKNVKTYEVEPS